MLVLFPTNFKTFCTLPLWLKTFLKPVIICFHNKYYRDMKVNMHWHPVTFFPFHSKALCRDLFTTVNVADVTSFVQRPIHSANIYKRSSWTDTAHGLFLPPANEVWGKVMFSHLSVSRSVHKGGGMLWCHFLLWKAPPSLDSTHHPEQQTPIPPDNAHPLGHQAVRILLECSLVSDFL